MESLYRMIHSLCYSGFILGLYVHRGDTQANCNKEGWVYWPDGDSCYYKTPFGVANHKSRDGASSACSIMGGQLASIVDNTEWQFIKNNVIGADIDEQYWIGLRKITGASNPQSSTVDRVNWYWQDQLPYSTTWNNWFDGANDEPSGEDACVRLFQGGFWGDTFCDSTFGYLCKIRNFNGYTRRSTTTATTVKTTKYIPPTTTTFYVRPTSTPPPPSHVVTFAPTSARVSSKASQLPISKIVIPTMVTLVPSKVPAVSVVPTLSPKPSIAPSNTPLPSNVPTTKTTKLPIKPSIVPSNIPTTQKSTTTTTTTTHTPPTTRLTTTAPKVMSSVVPGLTTTPSAVSSATGSRLNLPILIPVIIGALLIMGLTIGLGVFFLMRRRKQEPMDEHADDFTAESPEAGTVTNNAFYTGERSSKQIDPLPTWPEEDEEAAARIADLDNTGLI